MGVNIYMYVYICMYMCIYTHICIYVFRGTEREYAQFLLVKEVHSQKKFGDHWSRLISNWN